MRLDHIQKLEIECTNPNGVNPSALNPLIEKMREKLEALRLQDEYDDLKGRIIDLTGFRFEQPTPNLVMVFWQAKWEIIKLDEGRIFGEARRKASKLVCSVAIQENSTFMKVINAG